MKGFQEHVPRSICKRQLLSILALLYFACLILYATRHCHAQHLCDTRPRGENKANCHWALYCTNALIRNRSQNNSPSFSRSTFKNQQLSSTPVTPKPIPPQEAKIAVCFVGHVRTFIEPRVYQSILHNLIRPLQNDTHNKVDIFMSLGLNDAPPKKHNTTKALVTREDLLPIIPAFSPKRLEYFDNHVPPINRTGLPQCLSAINNQTPIQLPESYPPQLYRPKICYDWIRETEANVSRKLGKEFKYDWIVKARPDIAILDRISIRGLQSDTLYMNAHLPGSTSDVLTWLRTAFPDLKEYIGAPISDTFAMIPRRYARAYFSAWKSVPDCKLHSEYILWRGRVHSEMILAYHLVTNRVKYKVMDWMYVFVRYGTGAYCRWAPLYVGGSKADRKRRKERCQRFNEHGFFPGQV